MFFEKKGRVHREKRLEENENHKRDESLFRCMNCSLLVSAEHELSGVNNRNHCPNCLCSKHVDLVKAGDRKATCGARMQPIGLTMKHTSKKYGNAEQGELMIIHRCSSCGKISINRIAADDSTGSLLAVFKRSQQMETALLQSLAEMNIQPLQAVDLTTVYRQLFGWQSVSGEFTPPVEFMEGEDKTLTANDSNNRELPE